MFRPDKYLDYVGRILRKTLVIHEYDSMKGQKDQSQGLPRKVHVVDAQCSQEQCTHGQKVSEDD